MAHVVMGGVGAGECEAMRAGALCRHGGWVWRNESRCALSSRRLGMASRGCGRCKFAPTAFPSLRARERAAVCFGRVHRCPHFRTEPMHTSSACRASS